MQVKPAGNWILPIDKFCSNWHTKNSLEVPRGNAANFRVRCADKYFYSFRVYFRNTEQVISGPQLICGTDPIGRRNLLKVYATFKKKAKVYN